MKVFKYLNYEFWMPNIKTLLGGHISEIEDGNYFEFDKLVVDSFLSQFRYMRGFHGCCPINVDSYYDKGITPLCFRNANKWIKSFFSEKFPEVENKIIIQSIDEMSNELNIRENRVYFVLDDKFLISECGHYLLYGSEYILSVFATIESKTRKSFREHLLNIGQPTIFICNIPIELISEGTKKELAQCLIRKICSENRNNSPQKENLNFGFPIYNTLPSTQIINHYHPQNIIDPF